MGEIAKLIFVQPLADHDGAAILSIGIFSFELETGICKEILRFSPMLDEQVEEGREITILCLQHLFGKSGTSTPFLCDTRDSYTGSCEEVAIKLVQEVFNLELRRNKIFFFESWKSFPVLKSFCEQFCPEHYAAVLPKKPIDAESLMKYPRDEITTPELAFQLYMKLSHSFLNLDDGK